MTLTIRTAGLTVEVGSDSPRWVQFAEEACAGQAQGDEPAHSHPAGGPGSAADMVVRIERDVRPFDVGGFEPLSRGAWVRDGTVVLQDACASGADLCLVPDAGRLSVAARFRPSWRHRGLGALDASRQVLLLRAALIQYPALWWAGVAGRAPLHVSAAVVNGRSLILAGPGGVGKSTLIGGIDPAAGVPVSDNLCVSDGTTLHGLLEPARSAEGSGRRMPHGRRESPWPRRLDRCDPDHILVLRRGRGPAAQARPLAARDAERSLTAGTYAAGELRRYWSFAALLALGTGLGPADPGPASVARRIATRLPVTEVELPSVPGTDLRTLLDLVDQVQGERESAVTPATTAGSPSGPSTGGDPR